MSFVILGIYCTCIVVASVLGGVLPVWIRLTHTRMQLLMSFVGGLMLGVAILHMLPHALATGISPESGAMAMLAGVLIMFVLIRVFHVHQHAPVSEGHGHHHEHHEHHQPEAKHAEPENSQQDTHPTHTGCNHIEEESDPVHPIPARRLSWLGLFLGLSVHTLIDGVALAAAVSHDAQHRVAIWGVGPFLAILLHKPLDALSITSVMRADHWPQNAIYIANMAFALMCPLGAVLLITGTSAGTLETNLLVGGALAFSAGVFLCISLADLLPELQFHSHDRLKLTLALMAGVGLAAAIELAHMQMHGHSHG